MGKLENDFIKNVDILHKHYIINNTKRKTKKILYNSQIKKHMPLLLQNIYVTYAFSFIFFTLRVTINKLNLSTKNRNNSLSFIILPDNSGRVIINNIILLDILNIKKIESNLYFYSHFLSP